MSIETESNDEELELMKQCFSTDSEDDMNEKQREAEPVTRMVSDELNREQEDKSETKMDQSTSLAIASNMDEKAEPEPEQGIEFSGESDGSDVEVEHDVVQPEPSDENVYSQGAVVEDSHTTSFGETVIDQDNPIEETGVGSIGNGGCEEVVVSTAFDNSDAPANGSADADTGIAPTDDASPPTQPVRGRIFTEPAWKSLGRNKENEDYGPIQQSILELRGVISDLDRLLQTHSQEKNRFKTEIARLETRPTPKRVVMSVSPDVPIRMVDPSVSRLVIDCHRPLGLKISYSTDHCGYVVDEVKSAGCIPDWNKRSEPNVVAGDVIVEVNGVSGKDMEEQFSCSRIELVIEKRPISASRSSRQPVRSMPPPLPTPSARPMPPPLPTPPVGWPSGPRAPSLPSRSVGSRQITRSAWPSQSMEAYDEILEAFRNKSADNQPRTGIMKYSDVPVRVPDTADGCFRCEICRTTLGNEAEYVSHCRSQKHESFKERIASSDLWTRCVADYGLSYWYEHTMGVWSIDDPGRARTGSHTVIS